MIAAEHDGQRAGGEDMAHAADDLIEGLLDVGGDDEHVADIAHVSSARARSTPSSVSGL